MLSHFRSFKALVALVATASTLLLGGCGGGGAADPFAPGPSTPALIVNPTSLNVYSNLPSVLTISSGVAPFQVFTSDSVVLPVAAVAGGTLVTLVPANVSVDTPVTLTIRDAAGQSVAIAATVKPATLVNQVAITPIITNPRCGIEQTPGLPGDTTGNQIAVCSGETATASVIVRAANTSAIPNRQVRFDVVFGAFKFVTDANGANASSTTTLTTDQNGRATTLIKIDDSAPSQSAVIRVTDLVTGNRVDTAFTIVQKIGGSAVLSVVPGEGYVGTAFYKGDCGGTSGDFLVYGGRPPYTVRSSLPNAVRLSVGGVFSDPVIVQNAGGRFRASTVFFSGCTGYKATIIVTDSSGLNFEVTYEEKTGEEELPTAPAPTTLVISPKTMTLNSCPLGRTVTFTVIGGVAPYVLRTDLPADTTTAGNTVTVTAPGGVTGPIKVEVTDSKSNQADATITCL